MANERKSIRKSVDARFKLYFNKGCECGKFLNEHLLPDDVGATSLSDVFIACIEKLFCANIHTDSTRFANALIRKIGKYYEIQVRNPLHLRNLLKQVCEVFDACSNLISSKQLNACRFCDGDNEKEEPKAKKTKIATPKAAMPKKKTEVVLNSKRAKVSLQRMDFSEMAQHDEINLAPNSQNLNANNNTVIQIVPSSQKANDVFDLPSSSKMPANKVIVRASSMGHQKEIALQDACSTLVTVRSGHESPSTPDDGSLAPGDWSMSQAATPQQTHIVAPVSANRSDIVLQTQTTPVAAKTSNVVKATVDNPDKVPETPTTSRVTSTPIAVSQLIEVLEGPAEQVTNVSDGTEKTVTEEPITMDDVSEMIENDGGVGGTASDGTKNVETDVHSIHSSSDGDEKSNDRAADKEENESRDYELEEGHRQMDDAVSDVDPSYVRHEMTPDQVADYVIKQDASLEQFAMFVRNQRIDESLITVILNASISEIRTDVPAPFGDVCRFLKIIANLKSRNEKSFNASVWQVPNE